MASITVDQKISAAYVAFFQRSPDQIGLNGWKGTAATAAAAGKNDLDVLKEIAKGFATYPTFADLYKGLGNASFIDQIYLNVGGKAADANGKAYWKGLLDGGLTRSDFVASYIDLLLTITEAELAAQVTAGKITAAEKTDALSRQNTLLNKSEVALKFTNAMGSGSNLTAITDPADPKFDLKLLAADPVYQASKAIIAGVTDAAATKTEPLKYLDGSPSAAGINAQFGTDSVAPVVTAAQTFSYAENQVASGVVATVVATDNKAVTGYEITTGNTDGFYAIDATGKITLTTAGLASVANNFEATPNTVTLGVVAKDAAGNKSTVTNVVLNETNVGELSTVSGTSTSVKLTFDSALKATTDVATSAFKVVDSTGSNILVTSVNVSGSQVTLTLATAAVGTTTVGYTAPATGGLQDAAGNAIASLSGKTYTADTTAPTLSSSNAGSVAAAADLTLTFSEAIAVGTGNIVITNTTDATDVRTIAVTDAQVTVSGSVLTINPTADLKAGATYTVAIAATAVKDLAGNAYAGSTLNYSVPATVGSSLVLTSGVDSPVGTSANETIDGSRAVLSGQTVNTLGNADQIDGGAGTDTLFVQMHEALDMTPASLKNVEVVSVEAINAAGRTLSLVNGDASITTVKTANNAGALTISNIQSAPTAFEVSTTAAAFTASVATAKLTAASDTATLKLTNVTGAAAIALGNVAATGGNGYETISVTSEGTVANSITLDDTPGGAAVGTLATINVAGATNLTLASVANMTTVTKVDANTMTGNLTYTAAAANAQNMTVTGGSGNDIVDVQGFDANDAINGGAGTDRLVLTNAEAIAATTARTNVTNVEWLRLGDTTNGTTITVGNVAVGATGLQLATAAVLPGGATGNVVVNFAAGTANFDFQDSLDNGAETITLNVAGVATSDVANITLGTTTAAQVWNGGGAFVISGAETVNILSQGGANTISGTLTITNTAATEAIFVTGSQNLIITGAVTADSINASGMTSSAVLQLNGGTGTVATTITGTGNADVLIGSTAGDIISGGAGADGIANLLSAAVAQAAMVTAGDVLTGGAGFDTFTLRGDAAAATSGLAPTAAYVLAPNITDFTVGTTTTTTDFLQLSTTAANYAGGTAVAALTATIGAAAAVAAGATVIQSVAQNAAAAAIVASGDLIKLTTGVAAAGTLQLTFDAAIGTATVTGLTANADIFVTVYDTTNSKMLVLLADADSAAGGDTVIGTGDQVTLIGTVSMSAADYAAFNANNFALAAA